MRSADLLSSALLHFILAGAATIPHKGDIGHVDSSRTEGSPENGLQLQWRDLEKLELSDQDVNEFLTGSNSIFRDNMEPGVLTEEMRKQVVRVSVLMHKHERMLAKEYFPHQVSIILPEGVTGFSGDRGRKSTDADENLGIMAALHHAQSMEKSVIIVLPDRENRDYCLEWLERQVPAQNRRDLKLSFELLSDEREEQEMYKPGTVYLTDAGGEQGEKAMNRIVEQTPSGRNIFVVGPPQKGSEKLLSDGKHQTYVMGSYKQKDGQGVFGSSTNTKPKESQPFVRKAVEDGADFISSKDMEGVYMEVSEALRTGIINSDDVARWSKNTINQQSGKVDPLLTQKRLTMEDSIANLWKPKNGKLPIELPDSYQKKHGQKNNWESLGWLVFFNEAKDAQVNPDGLKAVVDDLGKGYEWMLLVVKKDQTNKQNSAEESKDETADQISSEQEQLRTSFNDAKQSLDDDKINVDEINTSGGLAKKYLQLMVKNDLTKDLNSNIGREIWSQLEPKDGVDSFVDDVSVALKLIDRMEKQNLVYVLASLLRGPFKSQWDEKTGKNIGWSRPEFQGKQWKAKNFELAFRSTGRIVPYDSTAINVHIFKMFKSMAHSWKDWKSIVAIKQYVDNLGLVRLKPLVSSKA